MRPCLLRRQGFKTVQDQNRANDQKAEARELGRNRGSVTRDVNKLRKFGLLRLREQVNPGHGVVQIVEPVAEKIEMRVAI